MNPNFRNFALWVVIFLLVLALVTLFQSPSQRASTNEIPYSQLINEAEAGRVHVGPRYDVLRSGLRARTGCWIEREEPPPGTRLEVLGRIRHAGELVPATLVVTAPGEAEVAFRFPVFAPAPGQAFVAYEGEAVLCGGPIERALGPADCPSSPSSAAKGLGCARP